MFLPNTGLNINNLSHFQYSTGNFPKTEINNNDDDILNNDNLDLTY